MRREGEEKVGGIIKGEIKMGFIFQHKKLVSFSSSNDCKSNFRVAFFFLKKRKCVIFFLFKRLKIYIYNCFCKNDSNPAQTTLNPLFFVVSFILTASNMSISKGICLVVNL